MGTRADFYVGTGPTAEWLGSVAYDGYPGGMDSALLDAPGATEFRSAVADLAKRDDWTSPEDGWPWPWDDSCTTDYAYCFDGDGLRVFGFGREVIGEDEDGSETRAPSKAAFPNMKDRQNVTLGARSGLLILKGR